jgi:hypothetical protein
VSNYDIYFAAMGDAIVRMNASTDLVRPAHDSESPAHPFRVELLLMSMDGVQRCACMKHQSNAAAYYSCNLCARKGTKVGAGQMKQKGYVDGGDHDEEAANSGIVMTNKKVRRYALRASAEGEPVKGWIGLTVFDTHPAFAHFDRAFGCCLDAMHGVLERTGKKFLEILFRPEPDAYGVLPWYTVPKDRYKLIEEFLDKIRPPESFNALPRSPTEVIGGLTASEVLIWFATYSLASLFPILDPRLRTPLLLLHEAVLASFCHAPMTWLALRRVGNLFLRYAKVSNYPDVSRCIPMYVDVCLVLFRLEIEGIHRDTSFRHCDVSRCIPMYVT